MKSTLTLDFSNLPAEFSGLVGPGSIYEANTLLESLPQLPFEGTQVAKSFVYCGFELWWMHYDSLYFNFCLPYTRYRPLLERLREYKEVHLINAPHPYLFEAYCEAHDIKLSYGGRRPFSVLPFGVFVQMLLSVFFVPALMVLRRPAMVYIGDKFERGRDHDFRFRYVYEELRRRQMPFVEFVRGVQPWRITLAHAWARGRPVIYTEAFSFLARYLAILSGGRARANLRFGASAIPQGSGEERFKYALATRYLRGVYEDVWAIRLMRGVLRLIGVRAALIAAASERSFAAVIACRLFGIPTVGVLHGVASRFYNVYEFMPGFTGARSLGVDRYGLWSPWWKDYFECHSKVYMSDQLFVAGLMRPLEVQKTTTPEKQGPVRTLFVSEEVAAPEEVLPYLRALLDDEDLQVTLKFRPTRDGFEEWLRRHEPALLQDPRLRTTRGTMQEAFAEAEVAVGCQSTGVLEALQQLRVPVYFRTQKWGDYYELKDYASGAFFAETPEELIAKIKAARGAEEPALKALQERYFGDPHKNGSAWAVEQLAELI